MLIILTAGTVLALPEGFSYLSDLTPSVQQEMRYFSAHNFVGRRIEGYDRPVCILTTEAAARLARVEMEARSLGFTLKVYDCYRPQTAVDDFVRWASNYSDLKMKDQFYPTLDKSLIIPDYVAAKSGHSRGSTVDLTLLKLPISPQPEYHEGDILYPCFSSSRFADNSIDMGSGFDCFHEISHTESQLVSKEQRENRALLQSLMQRYGFVNYKFEWWHFTLGGQPYPSTYFDFRVQ